VFRIRKHFCTDPEADPDPQIRTYDKQILTNGFLPTNAPARARFGFCNLKAVFRIRIGIRIRIICFWASGLRNLFVRIRNPDPSIKKQKKMTKNLDSYCLVTSLRLFIFEK
jgi:hypothetical protein